MRHPRLLWTVAIVPAWLTFALCAYWEPILRDGWAHHDWHRESAITLSNVWAFARESYLYGNPRLGQVFTLLLYTPGPYHVIVTPVVELLLFWILTALALGRRPQISIGSDALVFITIMAMVSIAAPQFGPMLFYRPFTANYLYGFVICAGLLVPYRLHVETPTRRRWWWTMMLLVLGVCAGMANEHTGITLALMICAAMVWFVRRGDRIAPWMIAGLVGVVAGGLALYYAPGQALRYHGLGNRGIVERIADRTVLDNARVVTFLFVRLLLLAPWLVFGGWLWWRAGRKVPITTAQRASATALVVAAVLVAITLLASPKQGPRLYFASVCFMCTAVAGVMIPMVRSRWAWASAWGLPGVVLGYALVNLVTTYRTTGAEFASRMEALERAPAHSVVTVPAYSIERSHWFLGEDFVADNLRAALASNRGLAAIVLESRNQPTR